MAADKLRGEGAIWLVSTCMNRFSQAGVAVLLNCFVAATFFPRVRLVLVTFGNDEEGLESVARCCSPFVHSGLLMLASGGTLATTLGANWVIEQMPTIPMIQERLAPTLMASFPKATPAAPQRGEAPAERAAASTAQSPRSAWPPPPGVNAQLTSWHASVAKNTAHEVARAVQVHSRGNVDVNDIAINVDCDNIVTPEFLEKVARMFSEDRGAFTMVTASTNQGAMTGRIAVRLHEFLQQGGYDENCFGTGYQDVDLKNRWTELRKSALPAGASHRLSGISACGGALPNDASSWKVDRSTSKTVNMDRAANGDRTWGQMNNINRGIMSERTKQRLLARNPEKLVAGRLGADAFIFTAPCIAGWLHGLDAERATGTMPTGAAASAQASRPPPASAATRPRPSTVASPSVARVSGKGLRGTGAPLAKARAQPHTERGVAPLTLISIEDVRRMNQPGAADDFLVSDPESELPTSLRQPQQCGSSSSIAAPVPAPAAPRRYPIAIMCTGLRRFTDYNHTACGHASRIKHVAVHVLSVK